MRYRKKKKKNYIAMLAVSLLLITATGTFIFYQNRVRSAKNSPDESHAAVEEAEDEPAEISLEEIRPESQTASNGQKTNTLQETVQAEEEPDLDDGNSLGAADEIIGNMSLEEKLWQMFILTPEQLTGVSGVTAAGASTKNAISSKPVGGIIYLAGNIRDPAQTKEMLSNTQKYADEAEGLPLFLCIDEEGGRVVRIADNPSFNLANVGPMSNVEDTETAYRCGETIGSYLSEYGFNVDFAPDVDVLTNSANAVIGDRSFGTDPRLVSDCGRAYSDGLHSKGLLSTFKHFPGHGATKADTHKGYAFSDKSYEELLNNELLPFASAEEYGVDMVMAAHISLPNVIGDDTPCSLSGKMLTEVLRNEFGYSGLIVTDALNMGAIAENYSSGEAAKKALKAGCDLLLTPMDPEEAYLSLFSAVKDGEISEERIDESLRRIINAKLLLQ